MGADGGRAIYWGSFWGVQYIYLRARVCVWAGRVMRMRMMDMMVMNMREGGILSADYRSEQNSCRLGGV
jgi:hypothetical protein